MADSKNNGTNTVQWVNHRDKEILLVDFGQIYETHSVHTLQRVVEEISGRPDGSVLLLADLSRAGYLPNVALKWQKEQHLLHSKCARMAVLGARGIIAIAAQTFLSLARAAGLELGRKVRFFENPDLAKEWLVQGNLVR
jgi:hypothetical protein